MLLYRPAYPTLCKVALLSVCTIFQVAIPKVGNGVTMGDLSFEIWFPARHSSNLGLVASFHFLKQAPTRTFPGARTRPHV